MNFTSEKDLNNKQKIEGQSMKRYSRKDQEDNSS